MAGIRPIPLVGAELDYFDFGDPSGGFSRYPGAGAQLKFGPVALRAKYERFCAAGAHPSPAVVGVSWSF